jgi:putative inorganic carbon (HCO3(-)) transporter
VVPQKLRKYLQWISLSSLALTCLAASPFVTFDAFNPPKLLVLSTCAGIALGLLFVSIKLNELRKYKSVFIVAGIFFVSLLASSIAAKQAFVTTFYGISGRNTGLLAYISLAVIFVSASIASDRTFLDKLKKLMLIVGVLSQIYAWYQILGFDTAPWSQESWIKSFFANPNFLSAFLGITAAFSNAIIFSAESAVKTRIYAAVYSVFTLFTMFKVGNTQGFIVFGIGLLLISYLFIKARFKSGKIHLTYLFVISLLPIWAILDMLQKTPGESYLWKLSVSSRGDFWRAAWNMALERPILGWGLDAYRDYFEKFRDARQATRGEGALLGEIAHNVFLDLLVGGGFLLLVSYVLIIGFSFFSILKVIKRTSTYDVGFAATAAGLVGYLAQSTISANHLGLAICGWIFLGSLIGYEINTREESIKVIQANKNDGPRIKKQVEKKTPKGIVSAVVLGTILGFSAALPLFLVNTKQMAATNNRNAEETFNSALAFPRDSVRMCMFAERLRDGGFEMDAITLAREAAELSPHSVLPLKVLTTFPSIPQSEKDELWRKIKVMDPYYDLVPRPTS